MSEIAEIEAHLVAAMEKASGAPALAPETETETAPVSAFDFDSEFQSKVAALALRSNNFRHRTDGLIDPRHFEDQSEAALIALSNDYWTKYKRCPDTVSLAKLVKDAIANKVIRPGEVEEVKDAIKRLLRADVSNEEYVVDCVGEFARHQAVQNAILDSVSLLEKRDFGRVQKLMADALNVGATEDGQAMDFFADIETRTINRKEEVAGTRLRGIPTGIRQLDNLLKHNGWGFKELTMFMGGPKVGKSTALADFAKFGLLQGFNVLYCTLEVSKEITADRIDANLADVPVNELGSSIMTVDERIKSLQARSGVMKIHEFPTGTMTCSMLSRLIERYKGDGLTFPMIVVDYADIMAPDHRTDNAIQDSKSIYEGLRAIAQREEAAVLSATQTNREGFKSDIAGMEHVAEDFNRVRIADLVISINKNDADRAKNVARLFLAGSRNQKGDITVYVEQDLERMKFIKKVLKVE